ncbi:MAG: LTA synthase family protein [Bacillota bacterium]|uniref:LTA synthase family protein n=1 Tax=Virgibacillus salarius TaxID=447199 RepID=A0A941E1Q2_9BACI|nr:MULTISPECIES: LTA synthase family protein [Virgibacillus]MBR7798118.1 LTA synthase family protein [Virgibacillus salarius]MCC2252618.1 LTA synthase family protein [Virgibacillus sp. AGTR]NAZ10827.1 sulfatase-like hydrolase/transferase [Agaribacter marinus]QRZ17406.1 LTA synthase family protein [Virgibacillus sp. AGTR]
MELKRLKIPLFIVATVLFGIKTYIVYRFVFSIDLENSMQELILFINPFVSAFLVFALSVWIRKQSRQMKFLRYTALIGTIILFANLVFYRSFTDFITIPQLFQGSNAADLTESILSLVKPYDILLFVDVAIIWYLSRKHMERMTVFYPRSGKVFTLAMSFVLLAGNFFLAEMERPQLFTRAFDREYLVKNIGLFNYHVYDIATHTKAKTQRVFADGNEIPDIKAYIEENVKTKEKSNLFGVAKDKNVIFINAESIQSFVINNEVNGQEITPFLNSLTEDEDTYYFENFYHQTEQGKTSDSEFIVENSLYPLSRGAVFFTHAQNEYHAMPEILKTEGYYSSVLHANNKSFWNRDQMYQSFGIDHFYGEEAYEVSEENSIGWGLKDKPFFEQSIKYLQSMEEPFYTKLITLTNHFPFDLDETDKSIEPYDSNSNTLNNFFPTVRYMDEAIEQFFDQLKDAGLYEDSIIIIMGDHYGISANHNRAMSMYLDKEEITPYDHVQLQRVPFFIHIPGHGQGEVKSEVSGQIDVKPTLLSLLGVENKNDLHFGNDLFSDERKGYIALRNGNFISDDYIFASDTCYNRETGEPVEIDQKEEATDQNVESACDPISKRVDKELGYSDDLIYGDLFRFVEFTDQK